MLEWFVTMFKDLWHLVVLAAVPIVLWWTVFYKRDPKKMNKFLLVKTFLVGCFSVIPILAYEKINTHYFDYLDKFEIVYLLKNNPIGEGFLRFLLASAFLSLILGLISAMIIIFLTLFSKENLKNIYQAIFLESLNFEVALSFIGVVIFVEIFRQEMAGNYLLKSIIGTLMIAAIMEEYVKHLILRFYDHRRIKSIDNAIVFAVLVGLGFAFIENIIYLNVFQAQLMPVFFARTAAVLGHLCFSAIFGYYYGVAHFAEPITYLNYVEGKKSKLLGLLAKISRLKKSRAFHEQKIFEGLVLSTVLHTTYNFFLEMNITFIVVPYLFGILYLVFHLMDLKESQKKFGIIGSRVMPVDDYEQLVWKINSIKWAEQIRAERLVQGK
ncbi:MAG: PrsW family glutamic-type intramembrane protease [Candidatus Gracilibacteria bacterium]|nr:PrsW family glutamic-type intramembrane protease [Candidatus Gracilibacteria bacterium]